MWKDRMSVGIDSWDQDHRELLRLIDEFNDLKMKESTVAHIRVCLNYLIEYSESHLVSEEQIMQAKAYPDFISHREKHNAYRRRVAVELKLFDDEKEGWNPKGLGLFLAKWWVEHITKEDKAYKEFFHKDKAEIENTILDEKWRVNFS